MFYLSEVCCSVFLILSWILLVFLEDKVDYNYNFHEGVYKLVSNFMSAAYVKISSSVKTSF